MKTSLCRIGFVFIVIGMIGMSAWAASDKIDKIEIKGNHKVSDATIISKIKIRPGQVYNENIINEDVKNLYATGFFETVDVIQESPIRGKNYVIFKVKEKPVVKKITITGTRALHPRKVEQVIDIKEGAFVDDFKLQEVSDKIKDLYHKKGFTQSSVSYQVKPHSGDDQDQVDVTFIINESSVVKVREVTIEGNNAFSDTKVIRVIKTRPAWLFNRGIFKQEVLHDDEKRIIDFYRSNGFIDVQVSTTVDFKSAGVFITVNIVEGQQYHIGKIDIIGNKVFTTAEIMQKLKAPEGTVFSEQAVYQDSLNIRELYVDDGYIFSQVDLTTHLNYETGKVDVTYKIVENEVAYIESVEIRGNTLTKDKVIRREIKLYPGDKYDGAKVRRSRQRLNHLGFFEEVRFGAEPGSEPNKVDLTVDVKEAKTGYVSFGGGYSSIDEFIGFVELRQRNFDYANWKTFTGAGQDISLNASFGTVTERYQLSFTNPWIFDKPISFGFDAYKKGHKREDDVGYAYEEDIRGGALRLGRQLTDHIKGGVAYRFDRVKISDVDPNATQELKDEVGINSLSSGESYITYDTRDNVFSPLRGIYLINTFKVTGGPFGGDKDFTKYFGKLSLYFPLIRKSVLEFRAQCGIANPFSNTEKIPIYERFFAGGAHTIRGYHERKVGPIDTATNDPIGGEALFVGNIEYTYPLADFLKVATFYDTGNVWAKNEDLLSGDLKSSIGLGVRVKTPIGPVNLDYGWPLDKEPGEDKKEGRFHFSISRGF